MGKKMNMLVRVVVERFVVYIDGRKKFVVLIFGLVSRLLIVGLNMKFNLKVVFMNFMFWVCLFLEVVLEM